MKLISCTAILICFAASAEAQDALRADQYKALKGLPELNVVLHQPNDSEAVRRLVTELGLDPKALANLITIALSKSVPTLRLSDKFANDKPYLEIGWFGNASGVSFYSNVWRWVRVPETNETLFVVVWREESLLMNPSRQALRDKLDDFLTAFGADYLRANR